MGVLRRSVGRGVRRGAIGVALAASVVLPACKTQPGGGSVPPSPTTSSTPTSTTTPSTVAGSVVQISAAATFSCALIDDGTVGCWGFGTGYGALGNGASLNSGLPVAVSGITDAVAISANGGGGHTCALLAGGTIRCWGLNNANQLGDGSGGGVGAFSNVPVPVTGVTDAVAVSAGVHHTCAIVADHTVRCWGANGSGQLGDGSLIPSATPVEVVGITDVVTLSAGASHTCATLLDGTARCWGNDFGGTLGAGPTIVAGFSPVPVPVADLSDVSTLAAGYVSSCATTTVGALRCWGQNDEGLLGDATSGPGLFSDVPITVAGFTGAASVAVGVHQACAARVDGTAACWGDNTWGQLGDGTQDDSTVPVDVVGLTDVIGISAGGTQACAVVADGSAWCWGSGANGQLGNGGPDSDSSVPVKVSGLG